VHPRLIIDLETRSCADLNRVGAVLYATDPSTSVTHVGWKNGGPTNVWQPQRDPTPPAELLDALADERVVLTAHNVGFERSVLSGPAGLALGLPGSLTALSRWSCTAARAAARGLPRDLAAVCMALQLPIEKDAEGHRLMLRVSRPRSLDPLVWWDDPTRMDRMAAYCARDVDAEALLDQRLPELSDAERQVWEVTEMVNARGIAIDRELLARLVDLTDNARDDLNARIATLTNAAVPKVSNHGALTRWLVAQGVDVEGTAKDVVEELLERDDLAPLVRTVLELRRDGGGASTAKAAAIARRLSPDGRLRDGLVYAGAVSTGRWSSHGAQLQNLPRSNEKLSGPDIMRDLADQATLVELEEIHAAPPLKLVSELLRSTFIASDGQLVVGDYEQIEARTLAWCAGQDDQLAAYRKFDRGEGPDPYVVAAALIYRIPLDQVTKAQRQIGKIATLALGYQGGKRAFRKMARNYGLEIDGDQAEQIKLAWRASHPHIEYFWRLLESAARQCVLERPGQVFKVRDVTFKRNQHVMTLRLPSGRALYYWRPHLRETETPWGEKRNAVHAYGQNSTTHQWELFAIYGGLLAANVVQAIARDIMADALVQLEVAGLRPVLCVHDEVVLETTQPAATVAEIMRTPPVWARGLPLAVKVISGPRYSKG